MNYRLLIPDVDKYQEGDEFQLGKSWDAVGSQYFGQKVGFADPLCRRPCTLAPEPVTAVKRNGGVGDG